MNKKLGLRTMVLAALMACAGKSQAQYNKTFTDSSQTSVDIVDATDGSGTPYSCVLATSNAYPIILHKTDFTGASAGIDQGYALNTPGLVLHPSDLLFTPNEEYLVVGTVTHPGNQNYMFAARFNAGGTMMWLREYPTLTTNTGVHICLVEDDPTVPESYIMVAGNKGATPGLTTNSIQAMRIGAGGNVMWNYKYFPPAIPVYPGATEVTDRPETIVYVHPLDGASRYYIGGSTLIVPTGTGSFLHGFAMSISNTGSIVDNYKELPIKGMRNQHAIFDARTSQVVIGYTTTNTMISTTSASAIGVSRFNTGGGLFLVQNDFYAHAAAVESAGYGIREDRSGTHYVVACEVYHNNPSPLSPSGCVAMLKIRKIMPATPVFFNEYNYLRQTRNTDIISTFDGTNENFTMAASLNGSRVISTDILGTVCGSRAIAYAYKNMAYTTTTGLYSPVRVTLSPIPLGTYDEVLPTATFCNPLLPDTYKTIAAKEMETDVKIYPTLLQQEQQIWMDINTSSTSVIAVSICNMDGRLMGTQHIVTLAGANHLPVDVASLPAGNYLVQVRAQDGQFSKTIKLSRL